MALLLLGAVTVSAGQNRGDRGAPRENRPRDENDATLVGEPADPLVDLVWEPVSDWAYVGQVFEVQLIARTDTAEDQTIAAIDVALHWDADDLKLLGIANDGPYGWLSSGFPDDSAQDGLNNTFLDGDAFYEAWSSFSDFAVASPQGLHVTTFLFEALQETESAQISIEESVGLFTESHVFGGDFFGQDVTGRFGVVSLRVCSGAPGDDDGDGVENCFDLCSGTPLGESVNVDGCGCSQLNCDDGQHCNGVENCAEGVCREVEPPTCDDGNECTADSCDAAANDGAGACANEPEPAGTPCGDPSNTDCDNRDSCDGNGTCLDNYEPQGTPCVDEFFCNGEEACDDAGICQTGMDACTDPWLPFCDENIDECVECLKIGDVDGDDDVNLQDFAAFAGAEGCQTGPGGPVDPPMYAPECRCLDADDDGDIDLVDFGYFQRSFSE